MFHRHMSVTAAALIASCLAACTTIGEPVGETTSAVADTTSQSGRLIHIADDIASRGETQTALALYERADELAEGDAAQKMRLGDAYLRLGENERAAKAYAAALKIKPEDNNALLGLGSARLRQGDTAAGLEMIAKAAPQVGTAAAYNRLGIAETLSGRFAEAEAAYRKALALDAADLDIKTNLALLTALSRRDGEAQALIAEVVRQPAASERHLQAQVLVLALADKADEARKAAPRGLAQDEVTKLLARAKKIAAADNAKAKGTALGAAMI